MQLLPRRDFTHITRRGEISARIARRGGNFAYKLDFVLQMSLVTRALRRERLCPYTKPHTSCDEGCTHVTELCTSAAKVAPPAPELYAKVITPLRLICALA